MCYRRRNKCTARVPQSGEAGNGTRLECVYATDLSQRAVMGMARTGASFSNGSGDYSIAFSTAYSGTTFVPNDQCSLLFEAAIEVRFFRSPRDAHTHLHRKAAEEAILNSLCKASTVVGKDGKPASAIPLDLLVQILRKRRVIADKSQA